MSVHLACRAAAHMCLALLYDAGVPRMHLSGGGHWPGSVLQHHMGQWLCHKQSNCYREWHFRCLTVLPGHHEQSLAVSGQLADLLPRCAAMAVFKDAEPCSEDGGQAWRQDRITKLHHASSSDRHWPQH